MEYITKDKNGQLLLSDEFLTMQKKEIPDIAYFDVTGDVAGKEWYTVKEVFMLINYNKIEEMTQLFEKGYKLYNNNVIK